MARYQAVVSQLKPNSIRSRWEEEEKEEFQSDVLVAI